MSHECITLLMRVQFVYMSEKPILWSNLALVVGYWMNGHVFERFACQQINRESTMMYDHIISNIVMFSINPDST